MKEFKDICDGLVSIHKPIEEDNKNIKFVRGLGQKYMKFRTVMSGKAPYPTFNQFINALKVSYMREGEEVVPNKIIA